MFRFGKRSRMNLASCHPDLQLIAKVALERTHVDFGITQGSRSVADQLAFFLEGTSRIDPRIPSSIEHGKHLVNDDYPLARAFDFIASISGRKDLAYDYYHCCYLVGVLISVADELYKKGEITHKVRTGADWDMDGLLIYDHKLRDLVHLELVGVKPFTIESVKDSLIY